MFVSSHGVICTNQVVYSVQLLETAAFDFLFLMDIIVVTHEQKFVEGIQFRESERDN